MNTPKVIKNLNTKKVKKKTIQDPVLITFQVEKDLRQTAIDKSRRTSITLSSFLKKCVVAFVENKDIEKQADKLVKDTTKAALR